MLTGQPASARSFYENLLHDRVVVLLIGKKPIQEREAALAALCGATWTACSLTGLSAARLSQVVGAVNYRVAATKDGVPYVARVSSVYVRRGDGWKLTFHQHVSW
ncbi:hypothetical protein BS330_12935 [Amycolatopsis keratiniphila subsp. nogabecina]|uniref:DUF4440 domain-containing protein n=1 Tax=Amycolatopsis keratiniphila subsp. keratiniphila TaxID=227715 RepID=A0A1W2LY79_9PSEU|nr:hypothetical protein BS330_12935 [Amycolatopsis keratiniphila subsp. nogabecina]ONF72166.1 hypothetical protein AVR91_0211575 [Amycolatopsis keratiniphila subsp. keratiniphila]SDU44322.1 hypothetical protein SAMN04489733_4326 [Amycolatopsis keratiniphila]